MRMGAFLCETTAAAQSAGLPRRRVRAAQAASAEEVRMSWVLLGLAIALEVAGTTSMKLSEGFTRFTPSVLVFLLYAGAFSLLIVTLKRLELGITYAIWSGVGTVATTAIGILFFAESTAPLKLMFIGIIVFGVVGLYLVGER
jgi:small multidrug resistance pump